MTIDLNWKYATIANWIAQEEQAGPVTSREDLERRLEQRTALDANLRELEKEVAPFRTRMMQLPRLADIAQVRGAEALLALFGLTFVVLDTTSTHPSADILRVLVMDVKGNVWSTLVQPQRQRHPNTAYTGITQEEMDAAPPLVEVWPKIRETLHGSYGLAYNLPFVRNAFEDNAAHYALPEITFVGECLQDRAVTYFQHYSPYLSLKDACSRIGHTLPTPATAQDRAMGQLRVLEAMTAGITSVQEAIEDATPEIDEHPF